MKDLTLENIALACGGTYFGNLEQLHTCVSGVVIDSRLVQKDYLYIPMIGAKVDGHDFIPQVLNQGALCVLTERMIFEENCNFILVKHCAQALKDIATFYRESLDITVVGITGSVGKTSTKEMVASVLEQKYKVHKTAGNYNNEIGLPLTIFGITEAHEVAVLEMGISDFGEMSRLTQIAKPDIGIITNIGDCHLEFLENRDGVLKAKSELFESMNDSSTVILNGTDEHLQGIQGVPGNGPLFFGLDKDFEFYADEVKNLGLLGTSCRLHLKEDLIHPTISIPGEHMVLNALCGACVGVKLGLSPQEICAGIESLKPVDGRNNIISTNHYTIIDDCYNANPVSMKASLDVLNSATGRKIAILGDMGELGVNELTMHEEVGAYASGLDLDCIICIGELAKHYALGALKEMAKNKNEIPTVYAEDTTHSCLTEVFTYNTKQDFMKESGKLLRNGDTILLKSSNFMKFGELLAFFKAL